MRLYSAYKSSFPFELYLQSAYGRCFRVKGRSTIWQHHFSGRLLVGSHQRRFASMRATHALLAGIIASSAFDQSRSSLNH
jgi:hypothetical protein